MQKTNLPFKKKAGLALLEIILGAVIITIGISVLVSMQSGDNNSKSKAHSGRETSMLINKILKYSETYLETHTPPYDETNDGASLKNLDEIANATDISENFIQQLKTSGITNASVGLTATKDPNDCHAAGNDCGH